MNIYLHFFIHFWTHFKHTQSSIIIRYSFSESISNSICFMAFSMAIIQIQWIINSQFNEYHIIADTLNPKIPWIHFHFLSFHDWCFFQIFVFSSALIKKFPQTLQWKIYIIQYHELKFSTIGSNFLMLNFSFFIKNKLFYLHIHS